MCSEVSDKRLCHQSSDEAGDVGRAQVKRGEVLGIILRKSKSSEVFRQTSSTPFIFLK